jgi:hypothetical protein
VTVRVEEEEHAAPIEDFATHYPDYGVESIMIADYAADYWLAAEILSSSQFFKPPFLFTLGHAFELAMKGILVCSEQTTITHVKKTHSHNLRGLWESSSRHLTGVALVSNTKHIESFSTIYDGSIGESKHFVRYPDRSHLSSKWPDLIAESVNAIGYDTWLMIRKLNSDFQRKGWQYKEWPAKTVKWGF